MERYRCTEHAKSALNSRVEPLWLSVCPDGPCARRRLALPLRGEERSVLDRFDQIRTPICRLKHASGAQIHLHFPPALQPGLHHAAHGPHIEAIDVVPARDVEVSATGR